MSRLVLRSKARPPPQITLTRMKRTTQPERARVRRLNRLQSRNVPKPRAPKIWKSLRIRRNMEMFVPVKEIEGTGADIEIIRVHVVELISVEPVRRPEHREEK